MDLAGNISVREDAVRVFFLLAEIRHSGRQLVFQIVHTVLDIVLVLWWLLVVSGPAVEQSEWWPVLLCFIVAVVQQKYCTNYHSTWLRGYSKATIQATAIRTNIIRKFGALWLGELKMLCDFGSVYANLATSGTLTDGWISGRTPGIETNTNDLTQIWNDMTCLDPGLRQALLQAGGDHPNARVSTFSDVMSEVIRQNYLSWRPHD